MTGKTIERDGKRYIHDEQGGSLEVKYGLPAEVKYCARCVISNQRPSSAVEFMNRPDSPKTTIEFDDEGICAACRVTEQKASIDWKERERELVALLDRFRSRNGSHDCIVPGSGGKDSAYAAHVLKYKYGMNPLTVTWAPHMYTDIGWKNFQNWIHVGGFDNYLSTPNGRVHRTLTRLAFLNLLHPFQPFILGQKNLAPRMAARFRIPLVIYGESEAEYGNPRGEFDTSKRGAAYFAAASRDNMFFGGVALSDIETHGIRMADLEPYMPLDSDLLKSFDIDVRYLGYYLKWTPQECYYYAVEYTGFEANPQRTEGTYSKYNSLDDKVDGFHYYTTWIKFGIGRATYDAAQEIRNNHITREEGVALVRRFDGEFPSRYFKEFQDYVSLDEAQFWETIERFRAPHLWKKSGNAWVLRHPIV